MLEARGLSLRKGGRALLTDAGLSLKPGELLTVLGPNGAGKAPCSSYCRGCGSRMPAKS
ncbi:Zinc import ATP-binding protein ZnuC [Chromobacterium violaceum]|uniref:Zinc import ATP-binding protein ZnuC n=1 Tax=Chromobacterium violaceum TaxID=536 RepID=A0A3S4LH06_CHRVL|nr:Zinc import ATP-binding protein ZnuC [Chromobacterium violaceum]